MLVAPASMISIRQFNARLAAFENIAFIADALYLAPDNILNEVYFSKCRFHRDTPFRLLEDTGFYISTALPVHLGRIVLTTTAFPPTVWHWRLGTSATAVANSNLLDVILQAARCTMASM
jgi:hypothetical protein